MNPALLLCLIICPLSVVGAVSLFHFGQVVPAAVFTAMAAFPLGIAGWQLVRFTNRDPDRLQRDEHVQKMFQLQHLVGVKEGNGLKQIAVGGSLTENPELEDRRGE